MNLFQARYKTIFIYLHYYSVKRNTIILKIELTEIKLFFIFVPEMKNEQKLSTDMRFNVKIVRRGNNHDLIITIGSFFVYFCIKFI